MPSGGQGDGRIQCHYDVLGCTPDADTSVIKKNHRKLVLKYHPDKNLGDDEAADKFILVQRAYEVLTGKLVLKARYGSRFVLQPPHVPHSIPEMKFLTNIFRILPSISKTHKNANGTMIIAMRYWQVGQLRILQITIQQILCFSM